MRDQDRKTYPAFIGRRSRLEPCTRSNPRRSASRAPPRRVHGGSVRRGTSCAPRRATAARPAHSELLGPCRDVTTAAAVGVPRRGAARSRSRACTAAGGRPGAGRSARAPRCSRRTTQVPSTWLCPVSCSSSRRSHRGRRGCRTARRSAGSPRPRGRAGGCAVRVRRCRAVCSVARRRCSELSRRERDAERLRPLQRGGARVRTLLQTTGRAVGDRAADVADDRAALDRRPCGRSSSCR